MPNELVVRYTAPGKYDVAPEGTIFKVMNDHGGYDLFVQCGGSSDAPNWLPMSKLLETAFKPFLLDAGFVSQCLQLSATQTGSCERYKEISKIITK